MAAGDSGMQTPSRLGWQSGDRGERTIIVSGADDRYYEYLQELVTSLQSVSERRYDIGILDCGLTAEQLSWLRENTQVIVAPEWPFEVTRAPSFVKASFCRPFLPRYFSGWDYVIWIDADTWLQDVYAIDLLIAGAREYGFAVVPLTDRGYHPTMHQGTFADWQEVRVAWGYGEERAKAIRDWPIISAGVVCGHVNAIQWGIWQELLMEALRRKPYFEADQASLCIAVWERRMPVAMLPSYVHWVCTAGTFMLDVRTGLLIERFPPHETIGLVALAGNSKTDSWGVPTTDGRIVWRYGRASRVGRRNRISHFLSGTDVLVDGLAGPRFHEKVLDAMVERGRTSIMRIPADSPDSNPTTLVCADHVELPISMLRDIRFVGRRPTCLVVFFDNEGPPSLIVSILDHLSEVGYLVYASEGGDSVVAVDEAFLAETLGVA
ncbi:MAG: hypothetical protein H7840_05210 [Alphaproteobacteria bacterium]